LGVSYRASERLAYGGAKTTKLGIYREHFEDALSAARAGGLEVVGIHCHSGWGFADDQLDAYGEILRALRGFVEHVPGLRYVNLGGGLGVPLRNDDVRLDLHRLAAVVSTEVGGLGVPVHFEPGDYLVKDAGVLLLQVTSVERKREKLFVHVDGGHGLNLEAAHYGLAHEIVPVELRSDGAEPVCVTIAGNVNEAIDVFAEDVSLPNVAEGDFLAMLHTGGYGASMSSNHCMRGSFAEYVV
jgi:diaminopimelate decarboxylase